MSTANRVFRHLCELYDESDGWPVRVRDLQGPLASTGTIHGHLRTLERRGLIERGPHPRDGYRPVRAAR